MTEHPSEQDWMLFLYEEHPEPRQQELAEHLVACETCRRQVATWQETITRLDEWEVHPRRNSKPAPRASKPTAWSWQGVVAMSLAFFVGFLVTKFFTPTTEQIRAEVMQDLRLQLKTDVSELVAANNKTPLSRERLLPVLEVESDRLITSNLAAWERKNSVNEQRLRGLLAELVDNQVSLRKDLEALALEAEAQILRTQSQLRRLQGGSIRNNALNPEIGSPVSYPNLTNPSVFRGP